MKTLYIVRHAKSSWADPGMSDIDRPLNERGMHDATMMAQRFADRKDQLDLLLSSPAKRAVTTARSYAAALNNMPVQEDRNLYLADVRMLMSVIDSLPSDSERVMIFGHNPGLSDLVEHLTNTGPGDLPTCSIVRINFNTNSWHEIGERTGHLAWWDSPKAVN